MILSDKNPTFTYCLTYVCIASQISLFSFPSSNSKTTGAKETNTYNYFSANISRISLFIELPMSTNQISKEFQEHRNQINKTPLFPYLIFSCVEFVSEEGGVGDQEIVVDDKLHGRGVKQINHGVQFSGKQCGAM